MLRHHVLKTIDHIPDCYKIKKCLFVIVIIFMVLLISANRQTIYIEIQKYNMILKTLLLLLVTISYTDHKIWEEILLPDSCSNQASLVNKLTVLCQN